MNNLQIEFDIPKDFEQWGNLQKEQFFKDLDDLMFTGDLTKELDKDIYAKVMKTMKGKGLTRPESNQVIFSIQGARKELSKLLDIIGELPGGVRPDDLQDLRGMIGDRVKQYLGNTYRTLGEFTKAADALKLTAKDMKKMRIVDKIIKEPLGGAHRNKEKTFEIVKEAILNAYNEFKEMSSSELVKTRMKKYSKIGRALCRERV